MVEKQAGDFEVEYAKTGRSICKGCRMNIAKDNIRIGTLTSSPFFDGLQQNWHHVKCLLKKPVAKRITGAETIHGFMNLRAKDQQELQETFGSSLQGDGTIGSGSANPHGLQCEYAKSSRSKCRACDSAITVGEVRLGVLVEHDQRVLLLVPAWHHALCFFEHHGDKVTSLTDFDGIEDLKQHDKDVINALMNNKTPPPAPIADEDASGKDVVVGKKGKGKKQRAKLDDAAGTRVNGKRPGDDDENGQGSSKRRKSSAPMTELQLQLREQTDALWEMKDLIKKNISGRQKPFLLHLLHMNGINITDHYSQDDIVSILADAMVFGVTQMCEECGKTRLIPDEFHYKCPTLMEWGSCSFRTNEPTFMKFSVPGDVDDEWLRTYGYKPRERIFLQRAVPSQPITNNQLKSNISSKKAEIEGQVVDTDKPFEGRIVACAGKLNENQSFYQKIVESGGGKFSKVVDKDVWFIVSTEAEVRKATNKIKQAEELGVDVVREKYITDCHEQNKRFNFRDPKYIIVANSRTTAPARPEERKRKGYFSDSERAPKTARLTVKGGAVVDPETELEETHHVLQEGNILWSTVLTKTDISKNQNSYYKLQVLEPDDRPGSYFLFRAWGRVGSLRGSNKLEEWDKETAKAQFRSLYEEKSGNEFGKKAVKHPGLMFPLEVDFGQDEDLVSKSTVEPGSKTSLPKPVVDIVQLIFDVQAMKQTLREMEIDLQKMPLGKLSANVISAAYKVLGEALSLAIVSESGRVSRTKIISFSNNFFTLIPHDFGAKNAPLLDNEEIIREKLEMLDALKDMEIATSLLKEERHDRSEGVEDQDPVDLHYRKLRTRLDVVDRDSGEYKLIEKCTTTTHAPTHTDYTLEVLDVFKVEREGEVERFKEFKGLPNKKLLWHGSRLTNFAGILSQGLRIAPPEAPVTGYMFGKGIYFADMVSKSANYCNASPSQQTALLLLSEVALGEEYLRTKSDYIETLPRGKNSTKGCGSTGPTEFIPLPGAEDIQVPMGPPTKQKLPPRSRGTELLYNEYIVYDVRQVRIRYMVKVKFDFGRRGRT